MTEAGGARFVHATALVIGERGVLVEGAAGTGKSSLAAALLAQAAAIGRFGRLVGDDRLGLSTVHGRLIARPHPAIAGLIERRGLGLLAVDHEPACVLHLAVRLLAEDDVAVARLPETPPTWSLGSVMLPLLALPASAGVASNAARVAEALAPEGWVALQTFQLSCQTRRNAQDSAPR